MTRTPPAYVMPPGEHLADELEARELTQKEFADILGRPAQAINEIIRGKKSITPDMALLLSEALGTSPEFWTNLQMRYDLWRARQRHTPNPDVAEQMRMRELLPVADLQKRGVLPKTTDAGELKTAVLSFLCISHLDEPVQMAANFRQSGPWKPENNKQLAWLKCVENEARRRELHLPEYRPEALDAAVQALLPLTATSTGVREIPAVLADAGVIFVLSERMTGSGVNGVALWLDGHPVVALSDHYPHLDRFWFNLLHELAHIRLEHTGVRLDEFGSDQRRDDPQEQEAHAYARDHLIPPQEWEAFVAAGDFTAEGMTAFAGRLGRHPSVVSGRYAFEFPVKENWKLSARLKADLKDELAQLRSC